MSANSVQRVYTFIAVRQPAGETVPDPFFLTPFFPLQVIGGKVKDLLAVAATAITHQAAPNQDASRPL